MRYIDEFKFVSPFFKEKATNIINSWTSEMNEFALKLASKYQAVTIVEARMIWIMYRLAELEAININSHIADDMQKEMNNQLK